MKLWLDDIRDPSKHGMEDWMWAKTAASAIACLHTGRVDAISLDHDITLAQTLGTGDSEPSGYDVVLWMEANHVWPRDIRIHSLNPTGTRRMLEVIHRNNRTAIVEPKA